MLAEIPVDPIITGVVRIMSPGTTEMDDAIEGHVIGIEVEGRDLLITEKAAKDHKETILGNTPSWVGITPKFRIPDKIPTVFAGEFRTASRNILVVNAAGRETVAKFINGIDSKLTLT